MCVVGLAMAGSSEQLEAFLPSQGCGQLEALPSVRTTMKGSAASRKSGAREKVRFAKPLGPKVDCVFPCERHDCMVPMAHTKVSLTLNSTLECSHTSLVHA